MNEARAAVLRLDVEVEYVPAFQALLAEGVAALEKRAVYYETILKERSDDTAVGRARKPRGVLDETFSLTDVELELLADTARTTLSIARGVARKFQK